MATSAAGGEARSSPDEHDHGRGSARTVRDPDRAARSRSRMGDMPGLGRRRPASQRDRERRPAHPPSYRDPRSMRVRTVATAKPRRGARSDARSPVGRRACPSRRRSCRSAAPAGRLGNARRQAADHPLPGRDRHRSRHRALLPTPRLRARGLVERRFDTRAQTSFHTPPMVLLIVMGASPPRHPPGSSAHGAPLLGRSESPSMPPRSGAP